jgi:crotonobetainyl-CoA:carnitine CoA-transferase CaiB-like acyl-CoA transferase
MTSISGARILELGGYIAAPFATLLLANLGAEVIKVESATGDPSRLGPNFQSNNAGKESVQLDLTSADGKRQWHDLVASADAVLLNLDAAAARKLEVTYDDVRQINPDIVYTTIRGFGPGPYRERGATNPIIEALCGLLSVTIRDGRPARQSTPFYDQMAGMFAALGTVAALGLPDRSAGKGLVEVDLFEVGLYSIASRLLQYQVDGTINPDVWNAAPYDAFPTADGWLFLGAISDGIWRRFCRAVGRPEAIDRPAWATSSARYSDRANVDEFARDALKQYTTAEAVELLSAYDVPCAPVNTIAEVLENPQVKTEGNLLRSSYMDVSALLPRFPVRGAISKAPASPDAPALGAHNSAILRNKCTRPEHEKSDPGAA